MILYDARVWVILVADVVVHVLLRHLNEHDVGDAISYLEATKLKFGPVVRQLAQKPVCWKSEGLDILRKAFVSFRMVLRGFLLLLLGL